MSTNKQNLTLIGVFDANGGILGEISYVASLLFSKGCALCKISHGLSTTPKPRFTELQTEFLKRVNESPDGIFNPVNSPNCDPLPEMELLHKNELSAVR